MRTLSDLNELVCQLDSRLTTIEASSSDHALENVDRTTRIEKLENNYDLLKDKLDCSRRNNMHVSGVSSTVPAAELETHIQALFAHLLGADCEQPVHLNRTHRVFSTLQQQKDLTPDVLTRVHYLDIKERIMQEARQQEPIVFRGDSLSIFQDLSAHTLACHREFWAAILHLRDQGILYCWGFPLHLHFTFQDRRVVARTPEEASAALVLSLSRNLDAILEVTTRSLVDHVGGWRFLNHVSVRKKARKQQ
ncbi:hypothetical protein NDU88_001853 [Pleurodeles waltl]|uniref:Uncharacterized protein n=1 Tax=Pleurodeles waltl TaxID=8319 RepID=A0AAV7WLT8_PLEWA|nr:hypothetical protein NDU88_001853 [Pleurodeles waltl]